MTLSGRVTLLRDAGFVHVGPVWQVDPGHVLAAVRGTAWHRPEAEP